VVDDERFFREAIRELLEAEGLAVQLASSAAEALEAAEDPSIGVAVLDIQLPDQSGLAVLRTLRDRRPALRVVMLSAHTDQEYVLEALRLGACDYLAKPLHEEEVKLSVRRALEAFQMASSWNSLRGRARQPRWQIEALLGTACATSAGRWRCARRKPWRGCSTRARPRSCCATTARDVCASPPRRAQVDTGGTRHGRDRRRRGGPRRRAGRRRSWSTTSVSTRASRRARRATNRVRSS
jgi:CheY-like chemotaxis protein